MSYRVDAEPLHYTQIPVCNVAWPRCFSMIPTLFAKVNFALFHKNFCCQTFVLCIIFLSCTYAFVNKLRVSNNTTDYAVNDEKLKGLQFGEFDYFCQTLFTNYKNQSIIHTYLKFCMNSPNFLPPNRFIGRFAKL